MKSFLTQQTTWATDWPVTRRTTQNPTPLPSTPLSHFCPSTPTTPHNPPLRPAAAAPTCQKTPSPLPHTPQPSLSTPPYRACPLLPRGWPRTLFPKSSTSEWTPRYKLKPRPDSNLNLSQEEGWKNVSHPGLLGSLSALSLPFETSLEVKRRCSFRLWTYGIITTFKTFSLFCLLLCYILFEKGKIVEPWLKCLSARLTFRLEEVYIAWMYYSSLENTPNWMDGIICGCQMWLTPYFILRANIL